MKNGPRERPDGGRVYRYVALFMATCLGAGCSALPRRGNWPAPEQAPPRFELSRTDSFGQGVSTPGSYTVYAHPASLDTVETSYAQACKAQELGQAACVDFYFHTACHAWQLMELDSVSLVGDDSTVTVPNRSSRVHELYRSSLQGILATSRIHGRWNSAGGLRVRVDGVWKTIPIQYHGFLCPPHTIRQILPVGDYQTNDLDGIYRRSGWGVTAVALSQSATTRPFLRRQQRIAATCLLRPTFQQGAVANNEFVWDIYDSLRVPYAETGHQQLNLAADTSAPFAYALSTMRRQYLTLFLQSETTDPDELGLFMLEPYQRGKIPVLMIHGLLSDRFTWANMANEICARPEFSDRFQLWTFQYPTGKPVVQAAALLRRQINELMAHIDPHGSDPALQHMLLMGHSMGGLISKLQITYSGDLLWQSVCNRPLEAIAAPAQVQSRLADLFYFDPSPFVTRVIFIGTPHRGSSWATRPIGRLGARLVDTPSATEHDYQQLLRANPNAFSREFSRRIPTSIDLLKPDSPMLRAIEQLPLASQVQLHSIIGRGRWMPGYGDSDGIVPVSSAHLAQSSETLVDAAHAKIHQERSAFEEVFKILRLHLSHHDEERSPYLPMQASPLQASPLQASQLQGSQFTLRAVGTE